jgi:hypothetical protein
MSMIVGILLIVSMVLPRALRKVAWRRPAAGPA